MSFEPSDAGEEMLGGKYARVLRGAPDDAVVYEQDAVGEFIGDGVVVMTDTPSEAPDLYWVLTDNPLVDDPERFDRSHGYWVPKDALSETALDEVDEDAPEPRDEAQGTEVADSPDETESEVAA